MNYTYEQLQEDLSIGREIEFSYKGTRYSITNTKFGWSFARFYDEESVITVEDYIGLLRKVKIDGQLLQDLWQDVVVDIMF